MTVPVNVLSPSNGIGTRPIGRLPVCICTDVGHDPDDLLALVLAAVALPLRLVVTSDEFGGGQRARLARFLLNLCGRTGVVVVAGAEIEGAEKRWVCDELVPSGFSPRPAPKLGSIVDEVSAVLATSPRAVWIGQGPMTNLANLYATAPELARRLTITQMGGVLQHLYRTPSRASHNLRMDPTSARAVLTAPDLDVSLVTSDITYTPEIEVTADSELYRLLAADNAPRWARLVGAGYREWFDQEYPGSKSADPLTVTAAAGLGFARFDTQHVAIAPDARMQLDPGGIELRMSVAADYPGFRAWVLMVVRHALAAGMAYDPTLVTRQPGDPIIEVGARERIGIW